MTARHGIVALHGEIDMNNAEQCRSACLAALADCPGDQLVIDLSAVTFIDSSGIQALLHVRRIAGESGIAVGLCGVRRHIDRMLTILGLHDVLPIVESPD